MLYFLTLVAVAFQKPMIFGYNNALFGVFLSIILTLFSIVILKKNNINKKDFSIYFICLIFLFLNSINNYFLGAGVAAFYDFIIGFFLLSCLFFVFLNFNERKNKIFILLLGVIIISTFITVLISGFDVENYKYLSLFDFRVKDRIEIDYASVLIPFSTIPWRMTVGDVVLPRATYLTIEPGVGVFIVLLWRYLCRNIKGLKSIIADIIMILALTLTASTTMSIMLVCWFAGRYFYENGIGIYFKSNSLEINFKKILLILILTIIGIYLFFYIPYFGYFNKIETHGESFDIRNDLYTSESGVYRYIRIILLILFYFSIRKYMCKSFSVLYSAIFFISILNVFAFTPLFFLSVFLAKKQDLQ